MIFSNTHAYSWHSKMELCCIFLHSKHWLILYNSVILLEWLRVCFLGKKNGHQMIFILLDAFQWECGRLNIKNCVSWNWSFTYRFPLKTHENICRSLQSSWWLRTDSNDTSQKIINKWKRMQCFIWLKEKEMVSKVNRYRGH